MTIGAEANEKNGAIDFHCVNFVLDLGRRADHVRRVDLVHVPDRLGHLGHLGRPDLLDRPDLANVDSVDDIVVPLLRDRRNIDRSNDKIHDEGNNGRATSSDGFCVF